MREAYAWAMQAGDVVNDYEILSVLGAGGFGITYLARDIHLHMEVALKEYFPAMLASRGGGHTVIPKSVADKQEYEWGLQRFRQEAQTLARFHHPNIVRVLRLFEANDTSYIVMEFEHGKSLQEILSGFTEAPSQEWLESILRPLLDGIGCVHEAGFMHRDIKPGNIYIRNNGSPVLLDFGSARLALQTHKPQLTTLVSPGYAPIEQYSSEGNQGPWSDIYALAGVFYLLCTGSQPLDAPSRIIKDTQTPLRDAALGQYSTNFLEAIEQGLVVDHSKRLQSIGDWLVVLDGGAIQHSTFGSSSAFPSAAVGAPNAITTVKMAETVKLPVLLGAATQAATVRLEPLPALKKPGLWGKLHDRLRSRQMLASLGASLAIVIFFTLHSMNVIDLPWVDRLETTTYDWRLSLALTDTVAREVVVVAVDDKSLAEEGRWPWDRQKLAKLTDMLFKHYDVQVVGYDILFPETSTPQSDAAFAQSIKGRRVILSYALTNEESEAGSLAAPLERLTDVWAAGLLVPVKSGFAGNYDDLLASARDSGFANIIVDFDSVTRRMPLLLGFEGNAYPSFALSVVRRYLGAETLGISRNNMQLGDLKIALGTQDGSVLIPYQGRVGVIPTYSAGDILHQRINPDQLVGKIVLVGATALGLGDYHPTPINYRSSGVEIQANLVEGVLQGNLKVASFKPPYEAFMVVLGGGMLLILMLLVSVNRYILLAPFTLVLPVVAALVAWRQMNLVIPMASVMLTMTTLILAHPLFDRFMNQRYQDITVKAST